MSLKWTPKLPDKEGWYWLKQGDTPQVAHVRFIHNLWVASLVGFDYVAPVDVFPNALWAGPIPEPKK